MKKYIWSVMLFAIMCFSIQAQTSSIQIKILTASEDEPLIGATVYFSTLEQGAVTNFDGNAVFAKIPDGTH